MLLYHSNSSLWWNELISERESPQKKVRACAAGWALKAGRWTQAWTLPLTLISGWKPGLLVSGKAGITAGK
ncbi:hypothetical protein ILYODFUR_020308 [Ilyodon furcidens]|uniref:Uncharacterized protein n=1 Tax=Ilyodon furcidens TaxID=33524 RepID=A0ABV0VFK2_9TELE